MKKLLDSYGARVLAFILCCLFAMTAIACAAGCAYTYYEPGMDADSPRNFAGSELAHSYAWNQTWNILAPQLYRPQGAEEAAEDEFYLPDPQDGFSCVIRDKDGKILEDTRLSTSQKVDGVINTTEDYTVEAYINLPVGRNTDLYGYVTLYDLLYNGRHQFFPVGMD